jgi:DNA-binding transcriptional regulator YiaG
MAGGVNDIPLTPYNVKLLRMELGMTQVQISRGMHCHSVTWGKWERGVHEPKGIYAYRVRQLMGSKTDPSIYQRS